MQAMTTDLAFFPGVHYSILHSPILREDKREDLILALPLKDISPGKYNSNEGYNLSTNLEFNLNITSAIRRHPCLCYQHMPFLQFIFLPI
jgi:hypothetical protein